MMSRIRCCIPLVAALLVAASGVPARADVNADRAAITARLQAWAAAFNARNAKGVCDIFAPDLVATVPGAVESGRNALCARLATTLAKPGLKLRYTPDIREIIVAGNIAVVRLFWTLTAEVKGRAESSVEAGMDVFQRQPDGRWSIIRFVAFTVGREPNGGLPPQAGQQ